MASQMGQLARVDQRAASYKFESSDRLLPSATSIPNSIHCRFADCSLDLNALAYTLCLCAILLCWLASVCAEDCVGEWAEIRNRVPNRVRLHHQIDQAFPIFRVKR